MATKKYLTKYARGSKAIPKLDDGLRAMQIQSQTQTQALEKRKQEQKLFDASYSTGLDRAAKAAEANRKLVRQIEVETPEKLRAEALKRNNITQQNNFKVKIKEQQVWLQTRRQKTLMAKRGLYANIHAKRKRIAAGSGEKMRKPGSKGAPTAANFRRSAKTAKPYKRKKK